MKIEDQIKRTVEQQVAHRPSDAGAFERVQRRFARERRIRVGGAIAGTALAIAAAVVVVPQLGTSSDRVPITSTPPVVATPTPSSGTTTPPHPPVVESCAPNCQIVERRNFASPVANATGIAFDGNSLWIMAGNNGTESSITEVDPVTGAVGRRHMLGNLAETAGSGVYGIASDGTHLWISVSGNTNKIVKVDPNDGSIVGSYSSPTTLGPSDLEFDGDDLWLSSGTGELFRLDPATGGVRQKLDGWTESRRDNGIAVRAGELWVGGLFEDGVAIQDMTSGELLDRIAGEDGRTIKREWGPMTFADGQLVLLDRFGITFYDVESSR